MLQHQTSRRTVLRSGGALVVGFSLAGPIAAALSRQAMAGIAGVDKEQIDSWLEIAPDGTATVYTGKVDLGTGVETALTQMAAEELGLPFDRVTLVMGDTDVSPDQGGTWGSLSIQVAGVEIRQAAATARAVLIDRAADKLAAARESLEATDGVIRVKGASDKSVPIADLIGGRRFETAVDKDAPVKDPKTHTIVGQSIERLDIPDKVTGRFTYMQDMRVPGMLHGRVVRPPALKAKLLDVDEGSIAKIPGIVNVVRQGDFLGVVAKTEWAAIRGSRALKARWSDWAGLPALDKIYDHVRNSPIAEDKVMGDVGDAKGAMTSAAKTLTGTYAFASQTHGSLGPSCAIAAFEGGRLTVHSASQAPHFLQKQLADLLKMEPGDVRVINVEGAGCYGRNGHEDASLDAAILARAAGQPVRVQWMREDEHGWDPKGPPTLVEIKGGLDDKGNVVAWDAEFWEPKVRGGIPHLIGAEHAGLYETLPQHPGNIHHNADVGYKFPNMRAVVHMLQDTPLRPSWIRSPGRMQNTYANEAFLDELAARAVQDPVDFRLRYLEDERGIAVLKAAAKRAGWQSRPSPDAGNDGKATAKGRGVSYLKYENKRTYVAGVAEVEVDRNTGEIRVPRIVIAHDCGQIINPDGTINQIEGQVVQTVSRTLLEQVTFDRSRVTSVDWESYPILRFPETPAVEIELINRPDQPPWGVGEPAACVVPCAISNAVFDATGVRLREVPYRPDYVKAMLKQRA
jgi:CO/xanthine dehydrogenase Mo-binding subunit